MNLYKSDKELFDLCSKRSIEALDELYQKYAAQLFTICIRYCDSHDEAKDLMHDAIIRAYEKIKHFHYSTEGSLYAWIRRLTINMAINRQKKKRRLLAIDDIDSDCLIDDNIPLCEDVSVIPESVLLELISHLRGNKRVVFNMYCIDGYSHKEIAKALSITENGASSILFKAKAQLRQEINEYLLNNS